MKDNSLITEEINVADAHPSEKDLLAKKVYKKFRTLTEGLFQKKVRKVLKLYKN